MSLIYLDHAATTPVRPEVREAMAPYLGDRFGNPSSHHSIGEAAAATLEDARARVAAVLGMRRADVVFTSGGTESNNLAIKGIGLGAMLHRDARHVVTSAIEHESVLRSCDYLRRLHGFEVTTLPVDGDGIVDPDAVAAAVREDTALVTLGYANNEIGTVQDAAAIAARTDRVPLHLDAVQAAGWLSLARTTTHADAISIAGHKIGAPQGTGVVGIRSRLPVEPVLHGGGQERERRGGTQNVAGVVGLATALELAELERERETARITTIRDALVVGILAAVPGARLTGHPTRRLPGTASFVFPGTNGEAVLLELERLGFVTSSGSACAAGSDEPSHVLLALGVSPDEARTAVRVTLGHSFAVPVESLVHATTAAVAAVGSPT
ncbi:cysteine desulfurase family protein [Microbacterium sediminicola]|uniref:Cysteine desulfurase family protein n=1 Tax=Microbacterium sediminicola TaxID=415210 RepID=A0ABN2I1N5_9MICO